jgi:hypothetical protein
MKALPLPDDSLPLPAIFALEPLEARRVMSDAAAIVSIDWQGQTIQMVQGEWIVSLTYPGSSIDEETGELVFNGVSSYSTTANPALDSALAEARNLGIEFERYLGSETFFLVKVPDAVSFDELNDALQHVPEFQVVEPNAVGSFDGVAPSNGEDYTWPEVSQPIGDGDYTWPETHMPFPDLDDAPGWPETSVPFPDPDDAPSWPETSVPISELPEMPSWPEHSTPVPDAEPLTLWSGLTNDDDELLS